MTDTLHELLKTPQEQAAFKQAARYFAAKMQALEHISNGTARCGQCAYCHQSNGTACRHMARLKLTHPDFWCNEFMPKAKRGKP